MPKRQFHIFLTDGTKLSSSSIRALIEKINSGTLDPGPRMYPGDGGIWRGDFGCCTKGEIIWVYEGIAQHTPVYKGRKGMYRRVGG